MLVESTPLSEVRPYRTPSTRLRRFDRLLTSLGFVAVGDAVAAFNPVVAAFNPVYGQGMSVAALEALAFRSVLRRGPRHLATAARTAVAGVAAMGWSFAAPQDRAWTDDRRRTTDRMLDRYLDTLESGASMDPVVAGTFAQVLMMNAGPTTLVRPGIVGRTAWHGWRRRRSPGAVSADPVSA